MPVIDTLQQGFQILKNKGPVALTRKGLQFGYETGFRTYHSLNGITSRGEHIFDSEWDVLIILDACRVDLMDEVSSEYEYIDDSHVDTFTSISSYSKGWMEHTFTNEYADEMKETAYITGNPFTDTVLDSDDFLLLDEVWARDWDESMGSIPPRPITDNAISAARNHNPQRLIIHYMQPHIPFITDSDLQFQQTSPGGWGKEASETIWDYVQSGAITHDEMWKGYLDNLRVVLDDVGLLLDNIDGEDVILTADHGNAVGEYGLYGHPRGIAIDSLREVPWVHTTASDSGEYEPEVGEMDENHVSDEEVKTRLQDLGYM